MGRQRRAMTIALLVAGLLSWVLPVALAQDDGGGEKATEETPTTEAPAAAAQLAIAIVDLTKVQVEYLELGSREKDLQAWADEQGGYLRELIGFLFLSAENFQEVVGILQKPQPTEAEGKRLEELRGVSDGKDKRFLDLRAKPQRTAQEEDEHNTLQETYKARQATLNELDRQFRGEFAAKQAEALGDLMGKVRAAITAEAEAQKFDYVLDADLVFFGGVDITESVLKRLNADKGNEGGQE